MQVAPRYPGEGRGVPAHVSVHLVFETASQEIQKDRSFGDAVHALSPSVSGSG